MVFHVPGDQSEWELLMRQNASKLGTPQGNLAFMGAQDAPAVNPQFDLPTLIQVSKEPESPAVSLGEKLPTNPFLASTQGSAGGNAVRKDTAEKMLYDLMKQSESTPSLEAQKESVNDYASKVKAYADRPVGGLQGLNLQPLAALSDAWNPGARLAQSYTAPETPQERAAKVLLLQGQAAGLQGALTKEQTDLMKTKLGALVGVDKANKDSGMMNSFLSRTDETNHRTVLQDVKKDETLKQRLQQSTNLANAFAGLDNAKIKTPQQFDLLQQSIRSNMGIKGTSGLSEREKDYFNNLGLSADRLEQIMFSTVKDSGASQADLVDHLRDLTQIEQQNIKSQAAQRLQTLISGNEAMYQRRPDLWGGIQSVTKAASKQFNPTTLAPPKGEEKSSSPQSKYRNMTPEQVKAEYEKKFGSGQ